MLIKNSEHRACLLTYGSKEGISIVRKYFEKTTVIIYNPDWSETRNIAEEKTRYQRICNYLDSTEYDYLISFLNMFIFREQDINKAKKGAINFHDAPPEHPGMAGYVYPLLFPEKRNFHGITVHEMNKKLDSGKIYQVIRFPIGNMTCSQFFLHSYNVTLTMLDNVCKKLFSGCPTKELLDVACVNEKWNEHYFSGAYEKELIKNLPKGNPIREMNLFDGAIIYQDVIQKNIIRDAYYP